MCQMTRLYVVVFCQFYSPIKSLILGMFKHKNLQMFSLILSKINMNNFYTLEVVCPGSKAQLKLG